MLWLWLSRRALKVREQPDLEITKIKESRIRFSPANYLINYRQFTLKFIFATSTNAWSRDTMREGKVAWRRSNTKHWFAFSSLFLPYLHVIQLRNVMELRCRRRLKTSFSEKLAVKRNRFRKRLRTECVEFEFVNHSWTCSGYGWMNFFVVT